MALFLTAALLASAPQSDSPGRGAGNSDSPGGQNGGLGDPDDGAARLDAQRPATDRAGLSLGKTLTDAFGGTTETRPAQYDVCSSSPADGLSYYAQWRIRDADPVPTLEEAAAAAEKDGWKVGETSPAEGQIPESVALTTTEGGGDLSAQLSVDDGSIDWDMATKCIRVASEEADKRIGPAS